MIWQDLNGNLDLGSSGDNVDDTKIEPTKAEAEAFARGLQVRLVSFTYLFDIYMKNSILNSALYFIIVCLFLLYLDNKK